MKMAGDTLDGCMPSKIVQEDMEVGQTGGEVGEFNASQEINSQPATQPLDASFDMETQSQRDEEDGVWGQLYPHCGTFPRCGLELSLSCSKTVFDDQDILEPGQFQAGSCQDKRLCNQGE